MDFHGVLVGFHGACTLEYAVPWCSLLGASMGLSWTLVDFRGVSTMYGLPWCFQQGSTSMVLSAWMVLMALLWCFFMDSHGPVFHGGRCVPMVLQWCFHGVYHGASIYIWLPWRYGGSMVFSRGGVHGAFIVVYALHGGYMVVPWCLDGANVVAYTLPWCVMVVPWNFHGFPQCLSLTHMVL